MAANKKRVSSTWLETLEFTVVAGAGFEPTTFGL